MENPKIPEREISTPPANQLELLLKELSTEIEYMSSAELRKYEEAIRRFYTQEHSENSSIEINEKVKNDVLEMEERLQNNTIDRKIWEVILNHTVDGWRLIEAQPEDAPTSLQFDKPDGAIKKITL
ncbi:MAG: hypothetical protein LBP53_08785 [Candidatus Peribacteria bacterium]|jgi:hypothetical protein|nr:hypothetical protein [Candidatus Peribacteria bacterium]